MHEKNKTRHLQAARNYSGEQWEELQSMRLDNGVFLLDNPLIFDMFAKIGAERQEDFRNPSEFNQNAREDAQTEYTKIRQEAIAKGLSPTNPLWPTAELQKLQDRIHGTANIAGRQSVSN